jgi:anti-anti-sigma factor
MPIARTRFEGTSSTRTRLRAQQLGCEHPRRAPANEESLLGDDDLAVLEICEYPERDSARRMVALKGEVDISNRLRLEERIMQLVDAGAEEIILNLSGVWFIDASGLRSLLACRELCEAECVTFALTPLTGTVKRVFALTGLEQEFCFETH